MSKMKSHEIDEQRKESYSKYPDITVKLVGRDGNAFLILGVVRDALKKAGVSEEEIDEFCNEAISGDYNHLLQTCMKWVNVT